MADKQIEDEQNYLNKDEYCGADLSLTGNDLNSIAELIVEKLFDDERINQILFAPQRRYSSTAENSSNDRGRGDLERRGNNESQSPSLKKMQDLIQEKNPLSLIGKNYRVARDYLSVIEIVYSELNGKLRGFCEGANLKEKIDNIISENNLSSRIDSVEFLLRIENFILVLTYQSTPAFLYSHESDEELDQESLKRLARRLTPIGRELLFFLKHFKFIKTLKKNNLISNNVQLLAEFFDDYVYGKYAQNPTGRNLLDETIHYKPLIKLNFILIALCRFITSGILQSSIRNRVTFISQSRVSQPELCQKLTYKEFQKKIENVSKRLQEAVSYFRGYNKTSITLYRYEIRLKRENNRVNLEQFKKFFHELNKKAAKPSAGFHGYLNFLYFWEEDFDTKQLIQDIVIIMDTRTLLNIEKNSSAGAMRNIFKEFYEYANSVLDQKKEVIFGHGVCPNLELIPQPILYHLKDSPPQLLIAADDRENRKIFETKVLPYFIGLEVLESEYTDDEVSTRFSRGQKSILIN